MNSFKPSNGSSYTYQIEDDIPTLSYRPQSNTSSTTYTTTTTTQTFSNLNSNTTYEENSYIDWNKESLQIPQLSQFSSLNISKKWITVIISAIILGYVTAAIDLISISLNDLKKGICLSKFDAWSLFNPYSTCPVDDWYDWSRLLVNSTSIVSDIFLNFPIYFIFAVSFCGIATYLSINKKILIKQSGIPEIKLLISGFNLSVDKYLSLQTLIYKIIGLILVVSSGLWLGKEGPLVHVSCCIFNLVYEFFMKVRFGNKANEALRREILSAATATGISVAFNSPIGGVLFVLESMPSYFNPTKIMWISFVSATIAIIGLTGINVFTDGGNFMEQDLFQVIFGNFSWLFLEIIPFTLLGIFGGVYGYCFIKLNQKFQNKNLRQKVQSYLTNLMKVETKWGPYLEVLAIVTITTVLNFPLEISKLSLSSYLKILFKECPIENDDQTNSSNFLCSKSNGIISLKLFYIMIQGFFLTSYTFGVDLPGGILMPSLVLGATTGRFLGIISQVLQSKFNWESLATCTEKSCLVSPSSYAVIGAASFMTGITKLTMCVVVIMFEMTGAISYVLPIMCGVMTSKFVNDWLSPLNIYDTWLQYNFNKDTTENIGVVNEGKGTGLVSFSSLTTTVKSKLPDVTVKSLMIPLNKVKCLCLINEDESYTQQSLYKFINEDFHEGYPLIVNYTNPIYIGYVKKSELYNKLQTIPVESSTQPISFQIQNLNKKALSMQLHYERNLKNYSELELEIETSIFYINELSPSILILEEFEKLHINNLIILNESYDEMSGFIDRFILTNQITKNFDSLTKIDDIDKDEFEFINNDINNEFDLENGNGLRDGDGIALNDDYDEIMNLRFNRKSIELIT
ncbi:GEF2 [Candida jiufengensis]|uniref:GEF2 n=1 Tax=Candida jiufengensis TaxID=497108 RepID=UPI002224A693|nr:GEF2 [Candida jiufengensis]KAI5956973.1 GEF2 [Candida jiufengensis]